MKKLVNITKIISMIMLLILLLTVNTFAIVKPTNEFFVNDYANVLSDDVEQYIINTNLSLENKTGAQIVVVTVPNLEGMALEEYANTLFNEFGIGNKNKNNGLLILLAIQERQCRIEVGYGLEGILTDAKTGRIQDEYMIPYLKENNWNEGIKNGYSKFLEEISNEYKIEYQGEKTSAKYELTFDSDNISDTQMMIGVAIIVITAIVFSKIAPKKRVKPLLISILAVGVGGCLIETSFGIICYIAFFVTVGIVISFIVSVFTLIKNNPNGSGRGSSSGGSSRSSSGSSHSSSSSHSGGGGRSGGGGSSRSF